MNESRASLKQIFGAALEYQDESDRACYLNAACGGDLLLRRRVEALLKFADQLPRATRSTPDHGGPTASAVDFELGTQQADPRIKWPRPLDRPLPTTPNSAPVNRVGKSIGPYRLLEQIGEGGMGTVYLGEQEQPIRRQVALKVIKAGMDGSEVIARFEAERQALALMDHPRIARVLDVGATESGRPYFVMELVQGIPITDYCDQYQLTTRERLNLFILVCRAIQHAHQKGIIHRDIKPSNILVACYDGTAEPKVIDFGVAKAIEQRLTDRTLATEYGAIIGTLEYMSPEQAELGGIDIDTRSDIYSLGVLLYELLTGSTPLQRPRVRDLGYSEILRQIREEEPPRPSTRLSDQETDLSQISGRRQTEPNRLSRLLRGDLDWIVMRALEKDRTRRYETASGLARDVQRYLDGDPVEASPPSTTYRVRKFARRHVAVLATASLMAFVLLGATLGAVGFAYWANLQHIRALAAELRAEDRDRELATRKREVVIDSFRQKLDRAGRSPDAPAGTNPQSIRSRLSEITRELDREHHGGPARPSAQPAASVLDRLTAVSRELAAIETEITARDRAAVPLPETPASSGSGVAVATDQSVRAGSGLTPPNVSP